jgi:hypothetical protein
MTGKNPELWDAGTALATGVGFDIRDDQTIIPMALRLHQSGYIVFRKSTATLLRPSGLIGPVKLETETR